MKWWKRFAYAVTCCVVSAADTSAGLNSDATAYLSWDRQAQQSALTAVPSQPTRLYVHLSGTSSVSAIAAQLRWAPSDLANDCYRIIDLVPVGADPDSAFGAVRELDPNTVFDGDSTYSWTISFPTASSHTVFAYLVAAPECASPQQAHFKLVSVYVRDTNGAIDTLGITGSAMILPQESQLAFPDVDAVSPGTAVASAGGTFELEGNQLAQGMSARLTDGVTEVYADNVSVSDQSHATATFSALPSGGASLDLIVENPSGTLGSLESALTLVEAEANLPLSDFPLQPSNHANAFKQIDLYAYRVTSGPVGDNVSHPQWPPVLDGMLTVMRYLDTDGPYDTVATIQSKPYGGIGLSMGASVEYTLHPPQVANKLGLIAMGGFIFESGYPEWNDYGKALVDVAVTHSDATTQPIVMSCGAPIRNWFSGALRCQPGDPQHGLLTTSHAPDVIYSGPDVQQSNTVHYDYQELAFGTYSPIAKVGFSGQDVSHPCSATDMDGTSGVFGLVVWPDFQIQNTQGDTVVRQSQYLTDTFGGTIWRDAANVPHLLGARGTIRSNGCGLTSHAMIATYFGHSYTPATLNTFFQTNHLYKHRVHCRIGTVNGTTVNSTVTLTNVNDLKVGDEVLVTKDINFQNSPIATIRVGPTTATGKIVEVYPNGVVTSGAWGLTYSRYRHDKEVEAWSNGILEVVTKRDAAHKTECWWEEELGRNNPLLLTVRTSSGHYVVADGWHPAYVSLPTIDPTLTGAVKGGQAIGTYSIKDPSDGYANVRLLEEPYLNRFQAVSVVRPKAGQGQQMLTEADVSTQSSLLVSLDGPGHLTVIGPDGTSIGLDPALGAYTGSMNALGWRREMVEDIDDPSNSDPPHDTIVVPNGSTGTYKVIVTGDGPGECILGVIGSEGDVSGKDAAIVAVGTNSETYYDVSYTAGSGAPPGLQQGTGLSVGDGDARKLQLRATPNPASEDIVFAYVLPVAGRVKLGVYDVLGRRVVELVDADEQAGAHVARWHWKNERIPGGLYFARVISGGSVLTRRIVLVR